jgi:alpha-galactosidase
LLRPSPKEDIVHVRGLKEGIYVFRNRLEKHNIKKFGGLINYVSPIRIKVNGKIHNLISRIYKIKGEKEVYMVNAEMLEHSGIRLFSQFAGTGFGSKVRVLGDFGSRIYLIDRAEDSKA